MENGTRKQAGWLAGCRNGMAILSNKLVPLSFFLQSKRKEKERETERERERKKEGTINLLSANVLLALFPNLTLSVFFLYLQGVRRNERKKQRKKERKKEKGKKETTKERKKYDLKCKQWKERRRYSFLPQRKKVKGKVTVCFLLQRRKKFFSLSTLFSAR